MLRNRKKLLISLLIVLSLGTIGWFFLFDFGQKRLESRIEDLATDLRQKGYIFAYSNVKITGNPLSVKATFQDPHIKDPRGAFEWQGQEVDVTMGLWEFYTLHCTFPGAQKVSFPQNTALSLWSLQLEGAKGAFKLTPKGKLEAITFTAHQLSPSFGTQLQPLSLEAVSLKVNNLSDPLNAQLSFATQLIDREGFLKSDSPDNPLTLSLEAALSGFQSHKPFPSSLADWREGGGILEVTFLKFNWPPIYFEAEGTLTLDKNMYPLGSFSSRIVGYQDALRTMVKLGWVKKKNASAVSFMLDLFSSSDEEGGKQLKTPITLQDKALSVGPARLFKLQPVGGS